MEGKDTRMKMWKRRTVGLWAAVLVLIGTETPIRREENRWKGIELKTAAVRELPQSPDPLADKIEGPVLLAEAVGPEPHIKSAAEPEAPPEEAAEPAPPPEEAAEPELSGDAEAEPPPEEEAEPEAPPEEEAEAEAPPEEASEPELSGDAEAEIPSEEAAEPEDSARTEKDPAEPDPLKTLGDSPEKRFFLFGDENWERHQVYASEEEAAAFMTTVEVPVWTMWKGVKSQGTMFLTVHHALAEDVVEIFTEIFNDPEQFPIESMGGFRYRTGTNGEHNNGTAIDINADQNFQVRDGEAMTGSCWEPGVNPYSIPEDGSVVRAFAAHGWSWGGNAWEDSADAATGYHDYMHFSYRGM